MSRAQQLLVVSLAFTSLAPAAGCSLPRAALGSGPGSDGGGLDVGALDSGADAGLDAGADADVDAWRDDTGVDAGSDSGSDAGSDAGSDSGRDAGSDAGTDAPSCTAGETRCPSDTMLETCAAGTWVPTPCPLGCLGTPAHCGTFTPSNVNGALTGASAPLVVSAPASVSSDTCTGLPGATGRLVMQDDAAGSRVCLYEVGSLTVSSTITIDGLLPIVFVAHGPVSITGVIDASSYTNPMAGRSVHWGPGSGIGGNTGGDGAAGGSNTDGGGGGGGFGGNGGNGANCGSSSSGGGGGSSTASGLVPLVAGADGGDGSGVGSQNAGWGGGGIQITSFVSIDIPGTVAAAGSAGDGGGQFGGGGGGGSGGAILLEAPTVTLGAGAASFGLPLTVAGGGGGGGGCGSGTDGFAGTDGAYAVAGRAAGAVTRCGTHDGGDGGGAATMNGANAMNGGGTNAPGGGGSVGRIVFRTQAGSIPSGTTNPTSGAAIDSMALTIR